MKMEGQLSEERHTLVHDPQNPMNEPLQILLLIILSGKTCTVRDGGNLGWNTLDFRTDTRKSPTVVLLFFCQAPMEVHAQINEVRYLSIWNFRINTLHDPNDDDT